MSEEPNIAVMFEGESLPKTPKATLLDWVKYYFYNLARKPKVWKKQNQLSEILLDTKAALNQELYPILKKNLFKCSGCRDAYGALKPQVFMSQIEMILKKMPCPSHHQAFKDFHEKYEHKFQESEEISAWINGFHK